MMSMPSMTYYPPYAPMAPTCVYVNHMPLQVPTEPSTAATSVCDSIHVTVSTMDGVHEVLSVKAFDTVKDLKEYIKDCRLGNAKTEDMRLHHAGVQLHEGKATMSECGVTEGSKIEMVVVSKAAQVPRKARVLHPNDIWRDAALRCPSFHISCRGNSGSRQALWIRGKVRCQHSPFEAGSLPAARV